MSEEEKQIMNKMIYCNLVSGEQALKFNSHIKEILQENKQLKDQLQQKENIIEEVREYIEHENFKRNILVGVSTKKYTRDILNKILEILDKEVN